VVVIDSSLQIFAADDVSGGWSAAQNATLGAAVVAGIIALIGTAATFCTAKKQRERDQRTNDIAFLLQQLNELYGPIYMLRVSVDSSYRALREHLGVGQPPAMRWALVEHIAQLRQQNDPFTIFAVTNILKVNKQIEDILRSKYGLFISNRPPASFTKFIEHSQQLRLAWDQGLTLPKDIRVSFPRVEFDKAVDDALNELRKKIDSLTAGHGSSKKRQYVDNGWPVYEMGAEQAVSELATDRVGALSPYGDIAFPLLAYTLPYIHPVTVVNQ
jgi:hypothetical protein